MSDDLVEIIGNMGAGFGFSKADCQLYALLLIRGLPFPLKRWREPSA
jgi:DNA-binding transcriptional regulator GbsR (MarR family)